MKLLFSVFLILKSDFQKLELSYSDFQFYLHNNFEALSLVFNLKLKLVKESDKWEDIRPNMIIINENFSKLEDRLNIFNND